MSHNQTAAKVRAHKENNPHLYCPQQKCLWKTGGGLCPRHKRIEPERTTITTKGESNDYMA